MEESCVQQSFRLQVIIGNQFYFVTTALLLELFGNRLRNLWHRPLQVYAGPRFGTLLYLWN